MLPLPDPVKGGSIQELKGRLNVNGDGFILAVAWTLAAFRHTGPFPILVLSGEHGTAKSSFSRMLRSLIDPNAAPLRALPLCDRDLYIAATNSNCLIFDNVSRLPG